jgi:RNA-directed DNA polymerase
MEGQLFKKTEKGTPQGGVLSPLLANIYLNHFDHWFAKRALLGDGHARDKWRKAGHANFMMVRYADDFVVFSNGTHAGTEAFKTEMKNWLAEDLNLTLSEEKTAITHYTDGFDFLGYTLRKTESRTSGEEVVVQYPSTESVQRAALRVKELTSRKTLLNSPEDQIDALNAFLRGWGEYFRHSSGKRALRYVGSRAHMRMWKWLVEKQGKQHGWRDVKAKHYRENTWQVGRHRLMILQSMRIEYPRDKALPNPYLQGEPVKEPHHYDPFLAEWMGHEEYGSDWTSARDEVLEKVGETCIFCGKEAVDVHHLTARQKQGGNVTTNLVPLCRQHHRQAERRNSVVSHKLREILLGSGEPDALKGACPVRGGGL